MESKTVIVGTIGGDCHFVGQFLITHSLKEAGFDAISLGACVPQEEFIHAAVETKADAILVSSLYGMGVLDCDGMREKCEEAGLSDILLYVGGILTAGEWDWEATEKKFREMGFNRVYSPETLPATPIADLKRDLGLADS